MKGNLTPGATSSMRRVVRQVGPDPPVLLVQDVVVDPAAARGLQQRVVQEEDEPPARREHPGHLVDRGLERVDVLEHQAHDDRVEGARRGTAAPRRTAAA